MLDSEAHRVVAAFTDNDPAGEGLIADLNVERSFPAIQSVFLDKVEVVDTSNLVTEKNPTFKGLRINSPISH